MTDTAEQRDLTDLYAAVGDSDTEGKWVLLADIDVPPAPLDKRLMASLEHRGQLFPVLLNSRLSTGNQYTVIDGRRRLHALDELGETKVYAIIHYVDSIVEAAIATTANAVRSANPENELEAIETLTAAGYTETQIAAATGLSVQTIRKRARLAVLPTELRQAVRDGKIKAGIAERLTKLPSGQLSAATVMFEEQGTLTGPNLDSLARVQRTAALEGMGAALFPEPAETEAVVDEPDDDPYQDAYRQLKAIRANLTDSEWKKLVKETDDHDKLIADRPRYAQFTRRAGKRVVGDGDPNDANGGGDSVEPGAG
jgi:ParB/RepB/Spo0J family partition protein